MKRITLLVLGTVLALLGGLWFLQGAGIVHLEPILCVANCEPVTGPQPLWALIGFATLGAGIVLLANGARPRLSN